MGELKKTTLYELHKKLGAKMVEFSGWEMPVQYTGIIEEHKAVRSAAGLFDVSHMGEILVKGPGALALIQKLITNDAAKLTVGQALYSPMCYSSGGIVDDLLVYRLGDDEYWLVVNASNKDKDFGWIKDHQEGKVTVEDISDKTGQIALQGPRSQEILSQITDINLGEIKYFRFVWAETAGVKTLVSRTGYTGEDGFELYMNAEGAPKVWQALLEAGKDYGLVPVGLGARDTLRFEARLPLYGHELNEEYTPLEAGLGSFVALSKAEDFIGKEALSKQKAEGITRKLVGFEMLDRGIPRAGYRIEKNNISIGEVTSGSFAPSLGKNLGLGYVKSAEAVLDNEITVIIRDKGLRARIIKTPFYKREVK
ncbi:glycine cleavage system aminomethyltransferase GcvT [Thermanaerosceptrum fracticalcis]|uniref:Aminomethyltransferase n=1 Tax=Thermanaerosceptrum fracticalcis TaxID=1712410 RepID=A0A7G6DZC1_THEFR|nr:glycine cleavage system aminomethyltransferase GcvT [Thermanaerosceptrum fracticalcis]QNB45175.1 glycine cleavage system aminomethyltransferase GcvT [Thermanaerosceptrum fracticalcis]